MSLASEFDHMLDVDEVDYDTNPPDLPDGEAEALLAADRHARAIRRLDHQSAQLDAVIGAEMERLRRLLDDRQEIIDRQRSWHLAPIIQLHERLLVADPRRRTIHLSHGTMKAIQQQAVIRYHDPKSFVGWASTHAPEWLRPREFEPDKRVVKAATIDSDGLVVEPITGEVVPGVAYEPKRTRFALVSVEGEQ